MELVEKVTTRLPIVPKNLEPFISQIATCELTSKEIAEIQKAYNCVSGWMDENKRPFIEQFTIVFMSGYHLSLTCYDEENKTIVSSNIMAVRMDTLRSDKNSDLFTVVKDVLTYKLCQVC